MSFNHLLQKSPDYWNIEQNTYVDHTTPLRPPRPDISMESPVFHDAPLQLHTNLNQAPSSASHALVLQNASHDILLQTNAAYRGLWIRNKTLEAEVQTFQSMHIQQIDKTAGLLKRVEDHLEANKNTVPTMVLSPSSRLSTGPLPPLYHQEDYPDVTIWTVTDWNKHSANRKGDDAAGIHQTESRRGKHKASDTEPRKSLFFLQNKEGISISEAASYLLTTHMRGIFINLKTDGLAPDQWSNASGHAVQYYRFQMVSFCDDFRLANSWWKVDKIATENYPSWAKKQGLAKVKTEVKAEADGLGNTISKTETEMVIPHTGQPSVKRKSPGFTVPETSLQKPAKQARTSTSSETPPEGLVAPPDHSTDFAQHIPEPDVRALNDPQLLTIAEGEHLAVDNHVALAKPIQDTDDSAMMPEPEPGTDIPNFTSQAAPPVVAPALTRKEVAPPHEGPIERPKIKLTLTNPLTGVRVTSRLPSATTDDPKTLSQGAPEPATVGNAPISKAVASINADITASAPDDPDESISIPDNLSMAPPADDSIKNAMSQPTNLKSAASGSTATAKARAFKFTANSCSEVNLFGREYSKTHARCTGEEVKAAYAALSDDEKKNWTIIRKQALFEKKEKERKERNGNGAPQE
ncbi:hypothetical protein CPB83DRAFT_889077 [Crepidotus variabilis]|uniref:Uncharacterized protein n=1 Tax=Crepidotus variabilis TaxID=179855 RepID=A0A9P6ES86_9AGAR|nr:hypothetical protein CPB83DRAFT_889077 [Crepidotus variabilis]